jgi:GTP-binding protein EngB required for normal cell division
MNTSTQVADWVRAIHDLTRRASLPNALAAIDVQTTQVRHEMTQITVTGGANSGKSTCINGLLGKPILPTSSIRSLAAIAVQSGDNEELVIDGHAQPIAALASTQRRTSIASVFVQDEWLSAGGIRLLEQPPLDATDDDLDAVLKATLRGADIVVLLINALMPVTRVDSALINECVRRGLPLIVSVAKLDELSPEERDSVTEYTKRYLAAASVDLTPIDRLREAIEATLVSTDVAAVRMRQTKDALLDILEQLELAAHAGLDAETMNAGQRTAAMKKREEKLESQNLAWLQIEQRLSVRRQKVDEQIRDHLAVTRANTLENLSYQLEKTSDINQWWTRELPFGLHRELSNVSSQISGSISRQIAGDVRWLQEELHRQFKYPLSASLPEPAMGFDEVGIPPSNVALANMQKFRVVSRLGTVATVLLASVALAQLGFIGATIAVSSLAGLAADQLAQRVTVKDRGSVRSELDRVVQRVWLDYAAEVSAKLKNGYDQLLLALKKEQARWNESQIQALRATPSTEGAAVDWQSVLDQTQTLAAEIGAGGN